MTETQKTINRRIKHFKTREIRKKNGKKVSLQKKRRDELTTLAIELKSVSFTEDLRRLLEMLQQGANGQKWINFERGKRETTLTRLNHIDATAATDVSNLLCIRSLSIVLQIETNTLRSK